MKNTFTLLISVLIFFRAQAQCSNISVSFSDSISHATVYFVDQSITTHGWGIEERLWNYGDSTFDTTITNPYHIYHEPGNYIVYLTIKGKLLGDSATALYCHDTAYRQVSITTTDIAQINNAGFIIYPNPSNGYIQIKNYAEPIELVSIYNMDGQLLSETDQTNGYIELPNNVNYDSYFVRIQTAKRNITKRILMIR